MTSVNDEMRNLISEAEALSYKTCEECGEPGEQRNTSWIRTLCDHCHDNWEDIKKKKWEAANKERQEGSKKK